MLSTFEQWSKSMFVRMFVHSEVSVRVLVGVNSKFIMYAFIMQIIFSCKFHASIILKLANA